MLTHTKTFQEKFEELLKSKQQVTVSSATGSKTVELNQLCAEARLANKAIIFTFTPGPFKTPGEMPTDWMQTDAAVGCTPQLTAFDKNAATLNAVVYAVNKHSSSYQCGDQGLLVMKKFNNLFMISDEKNELENKLGLATFELEKIKYLKRFTIAIKPNGALQIFTLTDRVNDVKAGDHINEIANFLSPTLEKKEEKSATAGLAI